MSTIPEPPATAGSPRRDPSYGKVDREYGTRLATTAPDEDGPIWMVNLMRYHDTATYPDGDRSVSGRTADERYAPVEILAEIGAEVVLFGDVDAQLLGDAPRWDRVGVVKYPSRRSFVEMQARDDFRARHVHKEAGLAETIVMGCTPAPLPSNAVGRDDLPSWQSVPHPPSERDGAVVVVHVIRYQDDRRDDMVKYQDAAIEVAAPHGGRIGGWFDVEGTIVGDGRSWDQVRCNLFPSMAAFMAVVADPARMAAHRDHREPAIADTYALVVRPQLVTFPEFG